MTETKLSTGFDPDTDSTYARLDDRSRYDLAVRGAPYDPTKPDPTTSEPAAGPLATSGKSTYTNSMSFLLLNLRMVTDAGLSGTKAVLRLSGTPAPSLPVPHIKLRGNRSITNLSPQQRNDLAYIQLFGNAVDFGLNDLFIDGLPIPDSSITDQDLDPDNELFRIQYDPTTGVSPLPDQLTFGTVVFVAGLFDKALDPIRDDYNVEINIDINPTNFGARLGNIVYFSGLQLVSAPDANAIVDNLAAIQLDIDDWRVKYFLDQTDGYPDDVDTQEEREEYDANVAELISSYQESGDFGSHLVTLAYFEEAYNIDMSDNNDPTTKLIIGAAKDASYVSPSSSLAAMFMSVNALAAGQIFSLGVKSSAGTQFTAREMMDLSPLTEDLIAGGIALTSGGLQLATIAVTSDHEIQPLTYATVAVEQGIGFYAAKMAKGDVRLLLATTDSAAKLGGAVAIPYSLAALSYATDYEYVRTQNGESFTYSPNPNTLGLYWAVIGTTNFSNFFSSYRAGEYLRMAKTTGDRRYIAPATAQGAALLLSEAMYIAYSTNNPLPKEFRDDYDQMLSEAGAESPFTNNNARGAMVIPAVTSLLVNSGGMAWGYLAEKHHEKKIRKEKNSYSPAHAELEAAGANYQALLDKGAAPEEIDAARKRLGRAQVLVKAQEDLYRAENESDGTSRELTPLDSYRRTQTALAQAMTHHEKLVALNVSPEEIAAAQELIDYCLSLEEAAGNELGGPSWGERVLQSAQITSGPKGSVAGLGVKVSF